jgi:Ca-activated chloride channel homolog
MTFLWPAMLGALVMIPALIGLRLWQRRRARSLAAKYGGFGAPTQSSGAGSNLWQPGWVLMLCGLALLAIGLARPQATVELPRLQGTVILAFDVSGSMAATDFEPTRLDAAKKAATEFVDKQPPGIQVGVVAFSDSGFTVQAPTNDREQILAAIDRLSPQAGTSLANGIAISLNTIETNGTVPSNYYSNATPQPTPTPTPMPPGQYSSSAIVLLSDGENNQRPDPAAAAQAAADRGVRIYTIGLGTAAGSLLQINGLKIRSHLDEQTLNQLASMTGGTYYNAPTPAELQNIYSNLTPELSIKPEQTEITALFAGAGALLLLVGALVSLLANGWVP